jgi:hypothetical protein
MEEPFKDNGEFENLGTEKIVCVNVSRTYLGGERESLYECTRKYWRLNGERAGSADLVFAICCGYIVGVFKPVRWYQTECEQLKGRWEFDGKQLDDSPYLNQSIRKLWGRRQNPVMYINL